MKTTVRTSREGRVALIELNRPEVRNAVDESIRVGLLEAIRAVGLDPEVRAVILTGVGSAFSAGADLKAMLANPDESVRRIARVITHEYQPIVEAVARLDQPVIAAINGSAVGIGVSLALCCDLAVMSEDASLMPSFTTLGLAPDGGASWFITRRVGALSAFELLAEGVPIPAPRCLELGLVSRVRRADLVLPEAMSWAQALAKRAPMAIAATKRLVRFAMSASLSETVSAEADMQTFLSKTEDAKEAVAAFAQKRAPGFRGT